MALVTEAKFVDYIKIAVIAWVAVFTFNRILAATGLSQFQATMNGGKSAGSNS